ncbi:hypothetical protein F4781DRAFT_386640 [Annulohypoxylon bovei var. microspora]|nr:hypothetical protein F4781DRAFT_386640 [Annulohypoxylon bovei var. microspora]
MLSTGFLFPVILSFLVLAFLLSHSNALLLYLVDDNLRRNSRHKLHHPISSIIYQLYLVVYSVISLFIIIFGSKPTLCTISLY